VKTKAVKVRAHIKI